jgi:hypothetical protein
MANVIKTKKRVRDLDEEFSLLTRAVFLIGHRRVMKEKVTKPKKVKK